MPGGWTPLYPGSVPPMCGKRKGARVRGQAPQRYQWRFENMWSNYIEPCVIPSSFPSAATADFVSPVSLLLEESLQR